MPAVEEAAKKAGHDVKVPFSPGRTDASQEMTDVDSFRRARTDLRRVPQLSSPTRYDRPAEELLVDRAHLLTLTAPEMTVLVGGMRVLNANSGNSQLGVFTKRPETLTNDFFVNLLDMSTEWQKSPSMRALLRRTGPQDGRGQVDWQLASISCLVRTRSFEPSRKSMPADDSQQKFVNDFVAAWNKVMNLDRFDLDPVAEMDLSLWCEVNANQEHVSGTDLAKQGACNVNRPPAKGQFDHANNLDGTWHFSVFRQPKCYSADRIGAAQENRDQSIHTRTLHQAN